MLCRLARSRPCSAGGLSHTRRRLWELCDYRCAASTRRRDWGRQPGRAERVVWWPVAASEWRGARYASTKQQSAASERCVCSVEASIAAEFECEAKAVRAAVVLECAAMAVEGDATAIALCTRSPLRCARRDCVAERSAETHSLSISVCLTLLFRASQLCCDKRDYCGRGGRRCHGTPRALRRGRVQRAASKLDACSPLRLTPLPTHPKLLLLVPTPLHQPPPLQLPPLPQRGAILGVAPSVPVCCRPSCAQATRRRTERLCGS